MLSLEDIKLDLKSKLSEYRYLHSIRVAEEAKSLARYYQINEEDAYLAGLIHDVAKEFNMEENKKWIDKYGLADDLLDNEFLKIAHAEIGAIVAKKWYGVKDNICKAIKYHAIGNIKMSMLDKIVFVADKIESGKKYPGIEEERVMAYQDIDKALILCLQNQKNKLASEGKDFNNTSKELLKFLLTNKGV